MNEIINYPLIEITRRDAYKRLFSLSIHFCQSFQSGWLKNRR
ncbi:hypothetical protein O23A_p1105 [Aeromonas salmonicida]|nr:hypothetical protein O23A_p1105 [Aeromonas salmonicida]